MQYFTYNNKYITLYKPIPTESLLSRRSLDYNVHDNHKEHMKFALLQAHHIDNQSIYGVYYIGDSIYAIDGLYKLDGSDIRGELRYINEYRLLAILFDGYRYFDIHFLNPGNIFTVV